MFRGFGWIKDPERNGSVVQFDLNRGASAWTYYLLKSETCVWKVLMVHTRTKLHLLLYSTYLEKYMPVAADGKTSSLQTTPAILNLITEARFTSYRKSVFLWFFSSLDHTLVNKGSFMVSCPRTSSTSSSSSVVSQESPLLFFFFSLTQMQASVHISLNSMHSIQVCLESTSASSKVTEML